MTETNDSTTSTDKAHLEEQLDLTDTDIQLKAESDIAIIYNQQVENTAALLVIEGEVVATTSLIDKEYILDNCRLCGANEPTIVAIPELKPTDGLPGIHYFIACENCKHRTGVSYYFHIVVTEWNDGKEDLSLNNKKDIPLCSCSKLPRVIKEGKEYILACDDCQMTGEFALSLEEAIHEWKKNAEKLRDIMSSL